MPSPMSDLLDAAFASDNPIQTLDESSEKIANGVQPVIDLIMDSINPEKGFSITEALVALEELVEYIQLLENGLKIQQELGDGEEAQAKVKELLDAYVDGE